MRGFALRHLQFRQDKLLSPHFYDLCQIANNCFLDILTILEVVQFGYFLVAQSTSWYLRVNGHTAFIFHPIVLVPF